MPDEQLIVIAFSPRRLMEGLREALRYLLVLLVVWAYMWALTFWAAM